MESGEVSKKILWKNHRKRYISTTLFLKFPFSNLISTQNLPLFLAWKLSYVIVHIPDYVWRHELKDKLKKQVDFRAFFLTNLDLVQGKGV